MQALGTHLKTPFKINKHNKNGSVGQSFARCMAPWVLVPALYKKKKKRHILCHSSCPLDTGQTLFSSNPVSRSLLSVGKYGGQWCCGNAWLGPGAIRERVTRKWSLGGSWGLEILHRQRNRKEGLDKRKRQDKSPKRKRRG